MTYFASSGQDPDHADDPLCPLCGMPSDAEHPQPCSECSEAPCETCGGKGAIRAERDSAGAPDGLEWAIACPDCTAEIARK